MSIANRCRTLYFNNEALSYFNAKLIVLIPCIGAPMGHTSRTSHIEDLADELIALFLAQAADLREYAQAASAGEGTVHLERTLRHREVQRADLYRQFEQAVFPVSSAPDRADQT